MEVKINPGRLCLQLGLWALVCGCMPVAPPGTGSATPASSRDTPGRQISSGPIPSPAKEEIIFISLDISQDTAGARRVVRMENLVKKPGKLKSRLLAPLPAGPYLTCSLLAGSRLLDTLQLEHPLFKNPEMVNAQNQLTRQAITLSQAEFFLRFEQKGAENLVIAEKMPGTAAQELIRIKL